MAYRRQKSAGLGTGAIFGIILPVALLIAVLLGVWLAKNPLGRSSSKQEQALSYNDEQLLLYAAKGDPEDVKRALQAEPNLNAIDPKTGETPIARIIQRIDNSSGVSSAVYQQELSDWRELAVALVKAGADVNLCGKYAVPPVVEARTEWTLTFLLDRGASVDGVPGQNTPLHLCGDHSLDLAELLLKRGANPNTLDYEGKTPLHSAAADNDVKLAALLISKGAQVNARDAKGYTPLKRARISLRKEAEALLLKAGGIE